MNSSREKIRLDNLADTESFAVRIAQEITASMTIGLIGELGAGKTTFVRYLCSALSITDDVSSPSFALQNIYKSGSGLQVEHWDLYRLAELPEELYEMPPAGSVRLIEWADKFLSQDPRLSALKVDFKLIFEFNDESRFVSVVYE